MHTSGSKTATALALELAQREINRNGRWENAKLVWLMSDGRANTGSPLRAARDLKDMGKAKQISSRKHHHQTVS